MVSIDSQIIFNLFSMLMKISQEKQNSDKLIQLPRGKLLHFLKTKAIQKKNQTLKTMSSYNLLWRDKKHFLRTWVKIHVIWRHLVTSWSNLKNHDRTFNNNQPINHVSILGRNLLFRVITFIPWYVLNYAKYKFLDKHLNISYPFI